MYILNLNNIDTQDFFEQQPFISIIKLHYKIKTKYLSHVREYTNHKHNLHDYNPHDYNSHDYNLFKFPFSNSTLNLRFNCTQLAPCIYMTRHFMFSEISIFLFGLFMMYLLCYMCAKKSLRSKKFKTIKVKPVIYNTNINDDTNNDDTNNDDTNNNDEAKRIEEKTRKLEENV